MKKLLAILMVALMVFSFAGCMFSKGNAVKAYVEANREELLASFEEGIAQSAGMECTSDITVEGNGFIIDVNLEDLDDLPQETKDAMQTTYDSLDGAFDGMLDDLKTEIPEIEYFTINVNEKDGDLIASITAGE